MYFRRVDLNLAFSVNPMIKVKALMELVYLVKYLKSIFHPDLVKNYLKHHNKKYLVI